MAQQTKIHAQSTATHPSRQPAAHIWETARPDSRGVLHPSYMARRKAEGSNLVKHALGTLLVLGALAMMVNA